MRQTPTSRHERHPLRPEAREPDPLLVFRTSFLSSPPENHHRCMQNPRSLLQYLIARPLPYASFVQLTAVFHMSFLPTPSIRP